MSDRSMVPLGATVRLGGPTIAHYGRTVIVTAHLPGKVRVLDGKATYVVALEDISELGFGISETADVKRHRPKS